MGKIFYIMGKSGSGKDSIKKELLSLLKENNVNIKEIIQYTNRPKRAGEIDGVDYHFVTDEKKLKEDLYSDKLIENRSYLTTQGLWTYYTLLDKDLELNDNTYISIGTLHSYQHFLDHFGWYALVPIYIYTDDRQRLIWMTEREGLNSKPCYEEVCRRYIKDETDFSEAMLNSLDINESSRFYNKPNNMLSTVKDIYKYIKNKC